MMVITSLNNDRVKELVKLKDKKYRDKNNLFFVEGYDIILEAYKNSLIKELYVLEGIDVNMDVPVIYVSYDVMKKISDMESISEYYAVCYKKEEADIGNKIIILDGVQDPGNLGTIIRSSAALGIDAIIVSLDTVDEYNDKVLRATQGAIFKIPIFRMNISEAIAKLKKDDTKIIVTSLQNSSDLKTIQKPKKFGIVLGNEAKGVHSEYLKLADEIVRIEMQNDVESLNVAMSAGIIIYYLLN